MRLDESWLCDVSDQHESSTPVAKPAQQFGHAMQIYIIIIIHFFRNWFLL